MDTQVFTFIMIILPIYLVSLLLYLIRAFKGPTISDSVLSIDAFSFAAIAVMGILSLFFKSLVLVSIAILLSVWTYALDVFVSKYLEKKEMGE
ncbi:MAG: multicomponent Na+:H+ antiporter subunit [Thermoproteota archaeon]|nr:multicomponent Na+:H+ antiporter subunit [Thermoproteota archaeon]